MVADATGVSYEKMLSGEYKIDVYKRQALVLYVDRSYAPENKNIGQVYQLLTLNAESDLNNLFDTLPSTHPAKAPFSLFKQASDSVRSGVIIGLGSRLQVFQSEIIKKITARDEIDLELPGQKPCAYSVSYTHLDVYKRQE